MSKKINYYFGNYFGAPFEIGLHVCNLYHIFGAGIAKEIKKQYPEAYLADLNTKKGDVTRLGTISIGKVEGEGKLSHIVNLYAMRGLGPAVRQLSYDALIDCLERTIQYFSFAESPFSIGIPYGMGCGLAGGDWKIVEAIIESCFKDYPGIVYVCVRDEDVFKFKNNL